MKTLWFLIAAFLVFGACQSDKGVEQQVEAPVNRDSIVVAHSLNGNPLHPVPETPASFRKKDSLLQVARTDYEKDPRSLDNIIWLGRRHAYLTNYQEAMKVYTRGLHIHPESPAIYRHRGHRYISMRKFEEAINDLNKAAELVQGKPVEIEPDGLPNKMNIPLSSLQFNIWYHLGLAHYLAGDYKAARTAYDSCMVYSTNPDLLCATTDWYYMTAIRLGDTLKAQALLEAITADMEIIENDGYHKRLLMYKGLVGPEELLNFENITPDNEVQVVTQGYGVANYLLSQGLEADARRVFDAILNTAYWPAFGYIAAEADVHRGI